MYSCIDGYRRLRDTCGLHFQSCSMYSDLLFIYASRLQGMRSLRPNVGVKEINASQLLTQVRPLLILHNRILTMGAPHSSETSVSAYKFVRYHIWIITTTKTSICTAISMLSFFPALPDVYRDAVLYNRFLFRSIPTVHYSFPSAHLVQQCVTQHQKETRFVSDVRMKLGTGNGTML
jgi:hypothetical protein